MPCGLEGNCRSGVAFKGVRRILVRGSMPPCAWGEENFENLTTKWCIHFEVYLNKYMVSIAPFSTPAFTPPPVRKLLFFACFRFLIFHPFFQGGSADPICRYVRTPMVALAICVTDFSGLSIIPSTASRPKDRR